MLQQHMLTRNGKGSLGQSQGDVGDSAGASPAEETHYSVCLPMKPFLGFRKLNLSPLLHSACASPLPKVP